MSRRAVFSHIRTKNYVRLAPAGDDAANNLQEARGNVMGRMKDGDTCRVHGVVPRHVVIEPREESRRGLDRPASLPRTTATKKDKRSGDNSCGIANEPSGHPNDGWLGGPGGPEGLPREAPIHLEKIPLFGAPSFPLSLSPSPLYLWHRSGNMPEISRGASASDTSKVQEFEGCVIKEIAG